MATKAELTEAHAQTASALAAAEQAHAAARAAFDAVGREPVPARKPRTRNPDGGPRLERLQQGGTTRAVLPQDFGPEQRRLYDEFRAAKQALGEARQSEAVARRDLADAEATDQPDPVK